MIDTSEKDFEEAIEKTLTGGAQDWSRHEIESFGSSYQHYTKRHTTYYNRTQCLDTEMLFNFMYTTQPEMWDKLKEQRGASVKEGFLKRVISEI